MLTKGQGLFLLKSSQQPCGQMWVPLLSRFQRVQTESQRPVGEWVVELLSSAS